MSVYGPPLTRGVLLRLLLVLVAATGMAFLAPGIASAEGEQVLGTLQTSRSGPIEDVEVTVTTAAGDEVESVTTDEKGRWSVDLPGPGDDPEAALLAARESEGRWMRGEARALDGIPATIKENIATRGTPVPLGTAARALVPAEEDAPPAARLRKQAGRRRSAPAGH